MAAKGRKTGKTAGKATARKAAPKRKRGFSVLGAIDTGLNLLAGL